MSEWQVSTYCNAGTCLEVRLPLASEPPTAGGTGPVVSVRDSKENGQQGQRSLGFTRAEWSQFLAAAKNGDYDLT